MLKTLKDLFDAVRAPSTTGAAQGDAHQLQLATAVLLVEVMRADPDLRQPERDAVMAALATRFALAGDELDRLVELAQQTAQGANDYFAFTSRINDSFGMEQKVLMIEHMWRVAYADGSLGAHENHLMRKVSDLLHIPHGAYVHAKMRAQQAMQA